MLEVINECQRRANAIRDTAETLLLHLAALDGADVQPVTAARLLLRLDRLAHRLEDIAEAVGDALPEHRRPQPCQALQASAEASADAADGVPVGWGRDAILSDPMRIPPVLVPGWAAESCEG